MRDDSIPLYLLIRSHSLLWLQTNQRTVNQSKQSLTIIRCSVKPLASRGSRLVTEIDCSCSDFYPIKNFIQTDYPESLVTRPAGQGERRLWERDCESYEIRGGKEDERCRNMVGNDRCVATSLVFHPELRGCCKSEAIFI